MSAALVVAILAMFVSFSAMVDSYRKGVTDELREVLRAFHTSDIRSARLEVRRAASRRRLSRSERETFQDAAITVLWAVQAVQPSLRHVRKTALVVEEATLLYRSIDSAVADLGRALMRHGTIADRTDDLRATNAALEAMPPVHDSWKRIVAPAPCRRLPLRGSDA